MTLPASGERRRTILCVVVFCLAVLSSLTWLTGSSATVAPDTGGYFQTLSTLFGDDRGHCFRTPFYPFLMAVADAAGHSGWAVLAFQIVCHALVSALMAAVLWPASAAAATVVGILLAADLSGAATSTAYLTESLAASGQVLCCALLIAQARQDRAPGRTWLLGAGILFGLALMIRPTGWVLFLPLAATYVWLLRSLVKPLLVAAGFCLVLAGIVLFNLARCGYAGIVRPGPYLAFPLFTQQLFDRDNGPVSRELDDALRGCYPGLQYADVTVPTSNEFIHQRFAACLAKRYPGDDARGWELYGGAYREAALAHPGRFAQRVFLESLVFLYGPAADYAYQMARDSERFDRVAFCTPGRGPAREDFRQFICPLPPPSPPLRDFLARLSAGSVALYQPYLLLGLSVQSALAAAAVVLAYWILALLLALPGLRLPVVLAGLLASSNAVLTAAGQVTLSRYVSILSPAYLLVVGIVVASTGQRLAVALRRATAPPARRPETSP